MINPNDPNFQLDRAYYLETASGYLSYRYGGLNESSFVCIAQAGLPFLFAPVDSGESKQFVISSWRWSAKYHVKKSDFLCAIWDGRYRGYEFLHPHPEEEPAPCLFTFEPATQKGDLFKKKNQSMDQRICYAVPASQPEFHISWKEDAKESERLTVRFKSYEENSQICVPNLAKELEPTIPSIDKYGNVNGDASKSYLLKESLVPICLVPSNVYQDLLNVRDYYLVLRQFGHYEFITKVPRGGNPAGGNFSETISLGFSTTESKTFSESFGITLGFSFELDEGALGIGAKETFSASISETMGFSESFSRSKSKSTSWSVSPNYNKNCAAALFVLSTHYELVIRREGESDIQVAEWRESGVKLPELVVVENPPNLS